MIRFFAKPHCLFYLDLKMEFVLVLKWVWVTRFNRMNINRTRH